MTYRGMTEGELQAFVREFRAFQIWREYTGFARDIYGVAAERVEVTTIAERNLGNSYLVIDAVHVYDARRRPLEPDLSTAWWQAIVCEYFPDDELYDDDAHEDWLSTMVGERQAALPVPSGGFDVFLASCPPRRSYATVYVDAAEPAMAL